MKNKMNSGALKPLAYLVLAFGIWLPVSLSAVENTKSHDVDHSGHASVSDESKTDHSGHAGYENTPKSESEIDAVEGRVAVMLSPEQKQLVNIRTTVVTKSQASVEMRTVGIVDYDETRIENINTKIMGWADILYVNKPGQRVEQNEPLMELYSPELYSAQQEYLTAYEHCKKLDHLSHQGGGEVSDEVGSIVKSGYTLLDSARKRLKLWDITDAEIAALEKAGIPSDRLVIRSPVSGFVIDKKVDPGQMTRPGMTLYRIANLETVWVNADVYEYELSLFKPGQQAAVVAKAYPDEKFSAKVDFIYPFSQIRTRTTTARLVLDNTKGLLKPGMYVDVEIEQELGQHLQVPKDAVFNTGKNQFVFVEKGQGHFEPVAISIGTKVGNNFIVRHGLSGGENVVIDGNFLLDSESQLKASGGGGGHNH